MIIDIILKLKSRLFQPFLKQRQEILAIKCFY